ncbi:glycerophosphodiester phosphodiesterase family protein [Gallaecimonas kandeliae]|uniref:glycerophosphodiester phosphodiesterase n=1 Tax=Gallaecimonas kandeliae TaxID=3029055 RepID=UPI002647015B|nr:glycerophosphodiester phosphodiesterase family protein [Gallaecimonas kandeliae]WKE66806.1 glycerophosphodiester phosphodiesterase family protein [Gallaecimonas kandeliae]
MGRKYIFGLLGLLLLPAAMADTMVISHRGGAGLAPENTLAAIQKGLRLGVDAIEVDVRRSKDGALVVFHDSQLARTTNGKGAVSDFTLAELVQLDAGSWFGPQFQDQTIPTLAQVMDAMAHSLPKLVLELKEPGLERQVLDMIRDHNMQDRVLIKAFDPRILATFSQLAPAIPRLYSFFGWNDRFNLLMDDQIRRINPLDLSVNYLQIYYSFLDKDFMAKARDRGIKVIAWGVQSRKVMEEMLALGVDGIETDYPDRLASLMAEQRPKPMALGYNRN